MNSGNDSVVKRSPTLSDIDRAASESSGAYKEHIMRDEMHGDESGREVDDETQNDTTLLEDLADESDLVPQIELCYNSN